METSMLAVVMHSSIGSRRSHVIRQNRGSCKVTDGLAAELVQHADLVGRCLHAAGLHALMCSTLRDD
ncbi:hypothetical protein LshimejAT787_1901020 [Lyophyllum shimeji]|uniref:Uncharacterized protein n=1 Tax=Lyophyllum shimeji TaxID=47721 RepID=A0A9P3URF7_LYOSH|nr:hypothetical protein LshimejAT787_1901020 [Lyophyllum shimeji]